MKNEKDKKTEGEGKEEYEKNFFISKVHRNTLLS